MPIAYCIGAQKCGTTSLHALLRQTGSVMMPLKKETKFFARDDLFARGLCAYSQMFGPPPADVVVEVDPEYMFFAERVAPRIYAFRPDARIIVLLRDPVERAFSHYSMSVSRGVEDRPFDEAVLEGRPMTTFFQQDNFSYFERGLYHRQLSAFSALFPRDQFLLLRLDEILAAPADAAAAISTFVGLPGDRVPARWPHENSASAAKSPRLARVLSNERLFELSKRTFTSSGPAMGAARWVNRQVRGLNRRARADGGGLGVSPAVESELRARYSADLLRLRADFGVGVEDWVSR